MQKRIFDLVVRNGLYKDSSGKEKTAWLKIGHFVQKDNGKSFITINRHFTPAGIPFDENSDVIFAYLSEPQNKY